jgi:hypothetical protein
VPRGSGVRRSLAELIAVGCVVTYIYRVMLLGIIHSRVKRWKKKKLFRLFLVGESGHEGVVASRPDETMLWASFGNTQSSTKITISGTL